MMALFESVREVDGPDHVMAGLLPGQVLMQKRLAGLGMQSVALPEGTLRGHTFHYSTAETEIAPLCFSSHASGRRGEAVYRQRRLMASYMHLYFPSNPEAVARLFSN